MHKDDNWDKKEMYVMRKLEDIENSLGKINNKLDKEMEERHKIDKKLSGLKTKLAAVVTITSTFVTFSIRSIFK